MADSLATQKNDKAMSTSSPLESNTSPGLLATLPPEIRNWIYELVIAPPDTKPGRDFRNAQPPSKELLLVCRQIYLETKHMYYTAYRNFWSEGWFELNVIDIDKKPDLQDTLARCMRGARDEDIAHISRLLVEGSEDCWGLDNGTWYWVHWADIEDDRVKVLVFPPTKERLLSRAGFDVESDTSAVTMRFIRTTDLTPEKRGEVVNLTGRTGLSKGEIVAVIEWVSCWLMLGPQTWMRDFD